MSNEADKNIYDVIVVGGGITGMVTAWKCQQAGLSVKVLEGRNRLGGRAYTKTETFEGGETYFDFGAHFIGHEKWQKDIWDLCEELGLQHFEQYEGPERDPNPSPYWAGQGANLLVHWDNNNQSHPKVTPYVGGIWPDDIWGDIVMLELLGLVKTMVAAIKNGIEGTLLKALETFGPGDGSVLDWMNNQAAITENVKELVNMLVNVGMSADSKDVSMLWFVFYIASSGGLDQFSNIRFPSQGAQGYRLVKGAQSVADTLGDKLREKDPDAILLNHEVTIAQFGAGNAHNIVRANGNDFLGRHVVFALSPILADKIAVVPPVPRKRRDAVHAMAHGETVMVCVRFKEAFWRNDTSPPREGKVDGTVTPNVNRWGLSGNTLVIGGPIVWAMDNVSYEGANAMFAFIVTENAKQFNGVAPSWRVQDIKRALGAIYGVDAVEKNFISMDWHNWDTDVFSQGCPAGHFQPNATVNQMKEILLDFMPEYQSGQLHFASTEAATVSNGYMSGAVWAGKKVAEKIKKALV